MDKSTTDSHGHSSDSSDSLWALSPLPDELHTSSDAAMVVKEIAHRLDASEAAFISWRGRYINRATAASAAEKTWLERVVPSVLDGDKSSEFVQADREFVKWAVKDAYCVVSPFVELRPPVEAARQPSTFFAKKPIPAGVMLFSIPTELTLTPANLGSGPPKGDDEIDKFYQSLEGLALSLATELKGLDDEPTTLSGYVRYLSSTTPPPRNLPYIRRKELFAEGSLQWGVVARCLDDISRAGPFPLDPITKHRVIAKAMGDVEMSLPQHLWFDFHVVREGQPVNRSAFRRALLGESLRDQQVTVSDWLDGALHRITDTKTATVFDVRLIKSLVQRRKAAAAEPTHGESVNPVSMVVGAAETTTPLSGKSLLGYLAPEEFDALLPGLPAEAKDEFHWLISMTLSRRLGDSLMVPLLDKLQHFVDPIVAYGVENASPQRSSPAAYYSMANRDTLTGVDVFENVIAGVESVFLYEPYVHVYALRDIDKGEAITLSYSDLDPKPFINGDINEQQPSSSRGDHMWKLLWGFLPMSKSPLSEKEVRQIAGFISGNRLHAAKRMFSAPIHKANVSSENVP